MLAAASVPDADMVVRTVAFGIWASPAGKAASHAGPRAIEAQALIGLLLPRVVSWASLLVLVSDTLKTQFLPSSAPTLSQASSVLQMPMNP